TPHGLRKFQLTLEYQIVGNPGPAAHDLTPRLKHLSLPRFNLDLAARGHLARHRRRPLPPVGRSAPSDRAIDSIGLLRPRHAPCRPLGCIRPHALLAKVTCKLPPPVSQGCLLDIEPHTLLAHGLDDHV